MSPPDRLTPEKEAEIEALSRELQEFEGDYHYPSGLLANGSHALLGLLEECRVLRAERDEYARRLPTSRVLVHSARQRERAGPISHARRRRDHLRRLFAQKVDFESADFSARALILWKNRL